MREVFEENECLERTRKAHEAAASDFFIRAIPRIIKALTCGGISEARNELEKIEFVFGDEQNFKLTQELWRILGEDCEPYDVSRVRTIRDLFDMLDLVDE